MHPFITAPVSHVQVDSHETNAVQEFNRIKAVDHSFYDTETERAHAMFVATLPKIEQMSIDLDNKMMSSVERGTVPGVPIFNEPKRVISTISTIAHVLFVWQNVIMMRLTKTHQGIKFSGLNIRHKGKEVPPSTTRVNSNFVEAGGPTFEMIYDACLKEGVDLNKTTYYFTSYDFYKDDIFLVVDIDQDVNWTQREIEKTSEWIGVDSDTFFNSTMVDPLFRTVGTFCAGGLSFNHGVNHLTRLSAYYSICTRSIKYSCNEKDKVGVFHDERKVFIYFNKKQRAKRSIYSNYSCNVIGTQHMLPIGTNYCEDDHNNN